AVQTRTGACGRGDLLRECPLLYPCLCFGINPGERPPPIYGARRRLRQPEAAPWTCCWPPRPSPAPSPTPIFPPPPPPPPNGACRPLGTTSAGAPGLACPPPFPAPQPPPSNFPPGKAYATTPS